MCVFLYFFNTKQLLEAKLANVPIPFVWPPSQLKMNGDRSLTMNLEELMALSGNSAHISNFHRQQS